jgi:DNA mismatch endonuclease (patch repair protein)
VDISFGPARLAVFVDGCFWHRCPIHYIAPKGNGEWWSRKLATNVARDRRVDELMRNQGWTVLRFWEHDDPDAAADRVAAVVAAARPRTKDRREGP